MVAILSTSALPEIRMTVDEYFDAVLPEGSRYELVEGVVEMTPIPGVPHDVVVQRLHRLLVLYSERRPDVVAYITQRCAVTLPDRQTAREPDFAVYGPDDRPDAHGKTWKDAKPILIVEVVSPGQEQRDYDDKRRDYWDAGIPEYWIADPQKATLTVMTRAPAEWRESVFESSAVYRPNRFPELEIPVESILNQ